MFQYLVNKQVGFSDYLHLNLFRSEEINALLHIPLLSIIRILSRPLLIFFFNALCNSSLKVLNLFGCHLGDAGASALAGCLYFNTNLRCVSLAKNRIGDVGAIALASSLGKYYLNESEIQIVDHLLNEESKQKISDEGGGLIKKRKGAKTPQRKPPPKPAQQAKGKTPVKKVKEERVHVFDPSAHVSAHVLAKWNSVQTEINTAKYLLGNSVLTTLFLDDNRISMNGYAALKEMLSINTSLRNFSIKSNPEISTEDALSISRKVEVENAQ